MVVPGEIDLNQISAGGRNSSGAAGTAFSSVTASKLELDDVEAIKRVPQIKEAAAFGDVRCSGQI